MFKGRACNKIALCLAVNKKGKVNWRGVVISVTLRRECASKIYECNFKSGEQDPVLCYPKTFVGTLDGSLTSWRDWLRSNLETKLRAQSRVMGRQ